VDIQFSWQNLYSFNKHIVDDRADRFFFVWDPALLWITGAPDNLSGHAPLHPGHPERGIRSSPLVAAFPPAGLEKLGLVPGDLPPVLGGRPVLVVKEDIAGAPQGTRFRLKDLCNIELKGPFEARYLGNDLSILKEGAKIIHWVALDAVPAEVQLEDGAWRRGVAEKGAASEAGKVVQFERFGFVRLDRMDLQQGRLVGFFAHK